jgi:hypothetical protein
LFSFVPSDRNITAHLATQYLHGAIRYSFFQLILMLGKFMDAIWFDSNNAIWTHLSAFGDNGTATNTSIFHCHSPFGGSGRGIQWVRIKLFAIFHSPKNSAVSVCFLLLPNQ